MILYLFIYLLTYISIYLSLYLSLHLSVYLSLHPSVYISVCLRQVSHILSCSICDEIARSILMRFKLLKDILAEKIDRRKHFSSFYHAEQLVGILRLLLFFLPSLLPSILPSFLSFLPSFHPSFHPSFLHMCTGLNCRLFYNLFSVKN